MFSNIIGTLCWFKFALILNDLSSILIGPNESCVLCIGEETVFFCNLLMSECEGCVPGHFLGGIAGWLQKQGEAESAASDVHYQSKV